MELAELRRRIERLENEVAALRGPVVPPAPPIVAEPPLVAVPPAAAAARPRPQSLADKLSAVPSTVWVAGVGAVIFLIGAIYGLTVSIQRGWVSPPVRVGAGLLTGVAAGVMALRLLLAGRRELGVTLLAVAAGTWTFALYFGAKSAHLFPLGLGFAGAAVATLFAGAVAARLRSDAAMAVALLVGLATPLAFSDGSGNVAMLLAYLLALLGAQLTAHYVTGEGADWKLSRVLGSAGVGAVGLIGAVGAKLGEPVFVFAALAGLVVLSLLLAWLPRHRARPEAPGALTVVSLVLAALSTWQAWRRVPLEREWFSVILVAFAALSLGVLAGNRRRGRREGETALLLLATGFGLLAVPVAIEWRWVVLAWGLGGVLLARAAVTREDAAPRHAAVVVTAAATLVWLGQASWHGRGDWIFLNPVFGGAALTAVAWFALLPLGGWRRAVGFGAAQFVAVNAVAWELMRVIEPVHGTEATLALGPLLATLTYAGAGAALWLRGVLYEAAATRAKALRWSGYAWLLAATVKLLVFDLSERDLLFRAVAALGVGAVFIGAALWADRVREKRGAA
jgi:uncharacterized membrane protein